MKYDIEWLNKERSRAQVSQRPGWLRRLFGRKAWSTTVVRCPRYEYECLGRGNYWRHEIGSNLVPVAMEEVLERVRPWTEEAALPIAEVVRNR